MSILKSLIKTSIKLFLWPLGRPSLKASNLKLFQQVHIAIELNDDKPRSSKSKERFVPNSLLQEHNQVDKASSSKSKSHAPNKRPAKREKEKPTVLRNFFKIRDGE